MTDSHDLPGAAGSRSTYVKGPSPGRRRWLRAGASAAPILMTVASRPVLATTVPPGFCQSPSGFVSGNASQTTGSTCGGRTPGYWKNTDSWPEPYAPGNSFCTTFDPTTCVYPGKTLLDVLNLGGGDGTGNDVARHIVAALLNASTTPPLVPVLNADAVKEIWAQYMATGGGASGFYSPDSGITKWYAAQIVTYLTSTMD